MVSLTASNHLFMLHRVQWLALAASGVVWGSSAGLWAQSSNGVLREVYLNAGGGSIPGLTNSANYPDNPSLDEILTNAFEAPTDWADSYGQRCRALVLPPITGSYVFYIATDDNGELWLSTDETPAHKQRIAWVGGWTGARQWLTEANQKSAPVSLVQGQRYYIEALQSEGGGGDNLAVGWQKPGDAALQNSDPAIPVTYLVPYGLGPPIITVQPTNVTVVEGSTTSFFIRLARASGATFQWLRNGTNLPGANASTYSLGPVTITDSNSTFRCFVTNPLGSTNSSIATLTVVPDTTRPTLVNVLNLGDNQYVSVYYSEPVEAATATNLAHYGLNNGAAVLGVSMGDDGISVILRTTPLSTTVTYTLTVSNVRDRARIPNTILANSQKTFSLTYAPLDASWITGTNEALGPSSRRTGLAITEIMYHPTNRLDGRNLEFVELYNSNPWAEDISGFRLAGDVAYTFPQGTTIGALGYRVIAPVPADLQAVYGLANVLGPLLRDGQPGNLTNVLDNGGGTVRLRNNLEAILLGAVYADDPPYAPAADGAGHSLVLARPSYGEGDPRAWAASDVTGGSPGANEITRPNPYRTVLINEWLAHTDEPQQDFIELFNYSASAVDLGGCWLSDDPATNKFRIPAGTTIPARGFVSFNQTQLGFALDTLGETLFFRNTNATKVLDAVRFGDQENGVAMGRTPDGAPLFCRLSSPSPGANNASARLEEVVINEIMYHPPAGEADEFVELYNRGTNAVDLGKWRLRGGITYSFPSGTLLPPGGFVVVANDRTNLLASHPALSPAITFGDYSGKLGNGGDTVQLDKPAETLTTNDVGQAVTNKLHIVVDEVTYGAGGRWGKWSDGGGSSLELVDPRPNRRLAPNWADSDEAAKSGWVTVECTDILDNGMDAANSLQLFLMGPGECLVDNVEVIPAGGANLVSNSNFVNGLNGWYPQGNQGLSGLEETGGFANNGRCLHVRATGRGDTGANRIRYNFGTSLSAGSTATLRMKVRWLSGCPEILMRLHGNYLEVCTNILTARNLGTPGAPNSRAAANGPPAITDVAHSPILPASGQAVLVRAQVRDPDGLSAVYMKYRIDPATNFISLPMAYSGAGYFSATIPAQASGSLAAFYIEAKDNHATRTTARFPKEAPARECLVCWGEPAPPGSGTLGTYRFWITQATISRWSAREKLSNEPLDATFACGGRLIYNIGAQYSGSPWHAPGYNSPIGNGCDYVLVYPPDDPWLGETELSLLMPGNGGGDGSAQRETHTYWIAYQLGLPFNYARHVNLFINGQRRAQIYVDSQQPNGTFMEQWFPDSPESDLYKMAIWFEMDDNAAGFNAAGVSMGLFTTTGGKKDLARYRWNWQKRAVSDSYNNYTNLFGLMDAANTSLSGEAYTALMDSMVDVNEWSRVFAVEKIIGNGDSYGNGGGQNMYTGKPEGDRWKMLLWDIDFAFAASPASSDMYYWSDWPLQRIFTHPPFQRVYYQTLLDAVNGPLLASRSNPMLDARYNAFVANGLGPENPQAIKDYIATRRASILATITNVVAPFAVTSNGGTDFSTNRNLIILSGTAPLPVSTITINGTPWRVNWDTVTNWTLRLTLAGGSNLLAIQGLDRLGAPVAGASDTLTVNFTGAYEAPQDKLVINELMYHPVVPNASYVEILNRSTANAFDLSNWRISGLDGDIPPGTIIQPGQFLVFVKDRAVFAATYGAGIPIAGEFAGSFAKGGETIALVQPGPAPDQEVLIERVTYGNSPPWPAAADGTGPSLQLIDPAQDHTRVANWAAVPTNSPPPAPQWQYVTASGTASSSALYIYLQSAGDVYIDDLKLVAGSVPEAGANALSNGDFESAFPGPWTLALYHEASAISTAIKHAGNASLHVVASSGGSTRGSSIYQDISPALASGQPYTLSFWYLQSTNGGPLTLRLSGYGIQVNVSPAPPTNAASLLCTPGAANSVRTNLPAFPPVWLNEVLPDNLDSLADNYGEHDPWVELYNGSTNPVSLSGLYLTDSYTNLTQWAFPAGASLTNRQFLLVWLDGRPEQSSGTQYHTSFRIPPATGSLALVQSNSSGVRILDYLNYAVPSAGRSYGDFPDGNVCGRQLFSMITPASTNDATGADVQVRINEWMADNTSALADPADGDYEDWFELYNPGTNTIDLSGYFLTDALTDKTKFEIPAGFLIAPGEYKVVWADGESDQNAPGRDLHVSFKLRASGQAIGLYAPGGGTIDALTFGSQYPDVSQGRFPDGRTTIYYMSGPTPGTANVIPEANLPPALDPLPDRWVDEGTLLTFTATATDPNLPAQGFSYSLDPGAPAGAMINADSGVFTWVPAEDQGPGAYSITVRVTDVCLAPMSDTKTFTVHVAEANSAPVITPVASQNLNEGATLVLTNSATDPDGTAQTILFTLEPAAPAGMTITANGVLTWTPNETQGPAAYLVTVRATDNGVPPASSTMSFGVVVTEVNSAPVMPDIPSQTNHLGHTFAFAANATDPDWPPNPLTYALLGAPAGAEISVDGIFTWTPTAEQAPRTNTFLVRALDNGSPAKSVLKSVTLVVLQPMSLLSLTQSNATARLRWSAIPGKAYQPQFKIGLGESAWTDLGQPVIVPGTNATVSDPLGTNGQRFYRVLCN